MKRFKKLGVLLGVLVVVCIATFALTHYEEEQEQIKNSDEIILEIPTGSVTSLSWEYAEEGNLAFHKGEEGWLYDEDEAFPVSEDKVNEILSEFEAFGVSFIIENVEDYSQYGLDAPEMTFHIGTEENTYEMKLGAFSTMDEQRYIDIGDGNVYLVSEDPMDYVSSALSDMILDDDTPGFENVVDIRFEGAENYMIQRLEDTNYSYSEEDVYFTQKNGEYLPLDKSAVTQYLNTITSLDLLTYVTYNVSDEELAEYGLDDPELTVTVNYTYTDEESEDEEQIANVCIIHLGRNPEELAAAEEAEAKGENAEDVSMYVRIGASQIVYSLDSVDYGILSDASYDDLRHQEVFWADFEDVTRIDITLEDTDHTLVSEVNEDEERVWYYGEDALAPDNTEETSETAAEEEPEVLELTDFGETLSTLTANSFTSEKPKEKEEIRFTLHLDNETFPTVEIVLYRYSGTECLAAVDGETISLIPRSSVMKLVETVQTIILDNT